MHTYTYTYTRFRAPAALAQTRPVPVAARRELWHRRHAEEADSRCHGGLRDFFASQDFDKFLRNSSGSLLENRGDCHFQLQDGQNVLRRFAETTNPRNNCAKQISKSWLVKIP